MTHHNKVINDLKLKLRICYTIGFFSLVGLVLFIFREPIISPCADGGCPVEVVYATEEKTELEEIALYIIKVFQPYGRQVAVKALDCFISESGLRPAAYNFNTNGTGDYNVSQINSVHIERYGNGFMSDWKTAIDVAEKIFVSRGKNFSAWYGQGCK